MNRHGIVRSPLLSLRRSLRRLSFLLLLGGLPLLSAAEAPGIPPLAHYATDLSGTLSPDQLAQLEKLLSDFDRETSTQLVLLVVPSIGDEAVEDVSLRVAEANKIGRNGKDNGVLLFISMKERRVRIETGYGLEGALPDITAGTIIRHEIAPRFRTGEYFEGINAGLLAIIAATKNEYHADPGDNGAPLKKGHNFIIIIFVVLFILFRLLMSGRRLGRRGMWFGGLGGGGFGSGGGGFGGGFSGGGGSFGGGGASGGW